MVENYLNEATSIISDLGCLPESMDGYDNSIMEMKLSALRHNDLDFLRLAIDRLLVDPSIDAASFAAVHFHFDQSEMTELLLYIRALLWPDLPAPNPDEIYNIQFVNTSSSAWWASTQPNAQ